MNLKEKIEKIFNKILNLVQTEYHEEHLINRYMGMDIPQRKEILLFELFPSGFPDIFSIDILQNFIDDSKKQAANYNKPELLIKEFRGGKAIFLYYYETEQEVFERLSFEYSRLSEEIRNEKAAEDLKYIELKSKYASDKKTTSSKNNFKKKI